MKLFAPAFQVLGSVLMALALLMLIPAVYSWSIGTGNTAAYLAASLMTGLSGSAVLITGFATRAGQGMSPRQMFLITTCVWLVSSTFAGIPLYMTIPDMSLVDAFFEAVSGMTTTGSTVLVGLDSMDRDVLLWRSLLQWMGGIGIIGMAVAVLPFLKVGGMKLFRTESSEWSDGIPLRFDGLLRRMLLVYMMLTVLCILSYFLAGMSVFNAINHALTTLSTGGYSTSDSSFGQFDGLLVHWVGTVFMLSGALPFVVYVRVIIQRSLAPFNDRQIRTLLLLIAVSAGLIAANILITGAVTSWSQAITQATFNIVSVITTTGYANTDYMLWGGFTAAVFLFVTFFGGCSGSTSGGTKIFRLQLSFMLISEQISRAIHPRHMVTRKYNGHVVDSDVFTSLIAYLFVMLLSLVVLTLLLAMMGLDLVTSLSGAATALMNVGPGLGDVIGPAGNFASLPDAAKCLLAIGMIMGRLEFLAVLVLFSKAFWRF